MCLKEKKSIHNVIEIYQIENLSVMIVTRIKK